MVDPLLSKQCTLSIRLSTDGFSFSIYNPLEEGSARTIDKEVDEARSLTANLRAALRELDFMGFAYKRVNVMVTGRRFTTVPLETFEGEEEEAETLFLCNHPWQENEKVMFNLLTRSNIVVIFGIDKSVLSLLGEQFADAHFYAQATPLIDYFGAKSRLGNSKKMYVFVRGEELGIYVFERGRLLLANSFGCACTADRLYYLLYVWKQLDFDQERDELHLAGPLPGKDELTGELKRFVRQVFVMNPATNIDLQALLTCE
ncbi:MAG: DUF3822 family protein [Mediterranea sp.]|jgi:hypothetical protein|nr:DUF3822 family protein [Mediterranea sp.]